MCMRACVCVFVDGWLKRFLSSASSNGVGLSGEDYLCELFMSGLHAKNRQRAVLA